MSTVQSNIHTFFNLYNFNDIPRNGIEHQHVRISGWPEAKRKKVV